MNTKEFYSNGKLLLSGEYLVLSGSKALVLPVKVGQLMKVKTDPRNIKNSLRWNSIYKGNAWFKADFNLDELRINQFNDFNSANYILKILNGIKTLRPEFFIRVGSVEITSELGFDPSWGFGSSSGLITNMAHWASVDPFELAGIASNGSGYDIAAAQVNSTFIYQNINSKPEIQIIDFSPLFSESIFFVYLGNKQNSEQEVKKYLSLFKPSEKLIEQISFITEYLPKVMEIKEFERLITEHEYLLSQFLNRRTVKDILFPDFEGAVKSLGAWGGDFVMMTSEKGGEYITEYLNKRNFKIFFPYDELAFQVHQGVIVTA